MYSSCTLILVMLTKKMRGASRANPKRRVQGNRDRWTQGWTVPSGLRPAPGPMWSISTVSPGAGTLLQIFQVKPQPLTDLSMGELMKKHSTWKSVRKWLQIRKRKKNQGQRGLFCHSNKSNFLFSLISEPQSRILSIWKSLQDTGCTELQPVPLYVLTE